MKIFYLGDFKSGKGPSQVDLNLTEKIFKYEKYSLIREQINKSLNKKYVKKIKKSDVLLISGVSFKGMITALFSKMLSKKYIYIMHGSLLKEKQYNKIKIQQLIFEFVLLVLSKKIICVSEIFSNDMKRKYTFLKNKILFINNGVQLQNRLIDKQKQNNLVMIGGGRKEKGILEVCQAVKELRSEGIELFEKIIVIGEDGTNKHKINNFEFVEWKGFINHNEVIEILEKNFYFIQNSYYEPFGIAPLEALSCGCKIILSENIPTINLIGLSKEFICKPNQIDDIKIKLINLKKITQTTNLEFQDWDKISEQYIKEINKIIK